MYVHVFCLQALPAEEEDSARQEKPQQRNQTPSQGKRKRSGQETAKPKLRKRMPLPPQATTGHITVAHVPPSGTVCRHAGTENETLNVDVVVKDSYHVSSVYYIMSPDKVHVNLVQFFYTVRKSCGAEPGNKPTCSLDSINSQVLDQGTP